MGLFGLFEKKTTGGALRKHAERVANKRAQAVDRWESIQFLLRDGSKEAVEGLLPRFSFYVDPSITDQEEKDAVFQGVVALGDLALPAVKAFLAKSESLSWPLKLLEKLEPEAEVIAELIGLLSRMDTEYERDPQRKIQLLVALEERTDARIVSALIRFLGDANETARFHAAGGILAQDDPTEAREPMIDALCAEESVRVRNRLLEGFAQRGWELGARREQVKRSMTPGFTVDERGRIRKVG